MAKRDSLLVIRAKSEADRVIESVSSALRTLAGVQDEVSGSGERTGNTLERLAGAFHTLDAAVSKIDQSVHTAAAAFNSQQASLKSNEASYAALRAEIAAAEQAIVNTRIAMQNDGSPQLAARLASAQQSYRALVGEAARLNGTLAGQRADLQAAESGLFGLEGAAVAAKLSIGELGEAGKREALQSAAASKEAETALRERITAIRDAERAEQQLLRDQIAAAKQEVGARNAQASINSQLGVRDIAPGAARASAEVFKAVRSERELADAVNLTNNALRARARIEGNGGSAGKASDTAFADQLRQEEEAARAAGIETEKLAAAAVRLKAQLNPLAAEEARLNAELAEAKGLFNAGAINIRTYTQRVTQLEGQLKRTRVAQDQFNRNGSTDIKNKLGLRPYEMQNLAYQVNDVITQLGSGAPLSQVFAQQAGQILQIFPKVLDIILKYWKGLGLVAAALTPVIIGMQRLNEVAGLQRDFAASLELSADQARYQVGALVDSVDAMNRYGASVEDASVVVKAFLAESVAPDKIDDMARATQNLAAITGMDLKDAAEAAAKAFTGGYDALAEFDDKMNFLTASEREQIRAMFESGDASDARALAFARFFDEAQKGADDLRSTWERTTRAMTNAWADFKDYLSDTSFLAGLSNELNDAAIGVTYLLNRMHGLNHEMAAFDATGRKPGTGTFTDPSKLGPGMLRGVDSSFSNSARYNRNGRDGAEDSALAGGRAGLAASLRGVGDPYDSGSDRAKKYRQDQLDEIASQKKVASARTTAAKAAAAGEKAYADEMRKSGDVAVAQAKKELAVQQQMSRGAKGGHGKTLADFQEDFNRALDVENNKRERNAENLGKTNVLIGATLIAEERRQAIVEAIAQAEDKSNKNSTRKLGLTQQQRAEIERTVGVEFDAQHAKELAQAAEQEHERAINDLIGRRSGLLKALEFTSPGSDDYKNLQSAVLGVNLQLEQATKDAIAFWDAVAEDPTRMALLGKNAEEVANNVADLRTQLQGFRKDALDSASKRAEAGLDDLREMQGLLQDQIEFAQLQGEPGRAGELAQQLAEVNDKLATGAQRAIEFWTAIKGNPEEMSLLGMTPEAIDNIILGLENSVASAQRLNTQFLATGATINQELARGGVTAMEEFAQSIVNGENVLAGFGKAFLGFAADFLMKIAEMIMMQALFNALSGGSAGGGGGIGGTIASAIGGLFHGGGVVAGGGRSRTVAAAMFGSAARYHRGGIAGFKPDEVPAILQRGEEVLTRADPRHRRNGGSKGGGAGLSQVLAIGEDQIAKAMAGAAGREVILTHIRTDRSTVRQDIGIDG